MDKQTSALVTLLFDDDGKVAMHALEQLLSNGESLDELIKEYQDSNNPHIRKRIHQVASIIARRTRRTAFIENIRESKVSLIEGLMQLSLLSNPKLSEVYLEKQYQVLVKKVESCPTDTEHLVNFMRRCNFFVPETFCLEAELLQLDNVLKYRLGAPIILAALAKSLGDIIGWNSQIVVYEGIFCLIDEERNLINPTYSWKVSPIDTLERSFPCENKDVWYNIMSQLFLASLQDGDMQNIHLYGSLLTELFDSNFKELPYPVGDLLP